MNQKLFGLLVVLLAVVGVSCGNTTQTDRPKPPDSITLNLMTFNIQAARHSTHTNKTRTKKPLSVAQDLEKIATVIEKNKPDVLFLQEVMRFDRYVENIDEFAWLQKRLGYPAGRFASGKADPVPPGTPEWGVAIYLRTGRIISTEKHLLGSNRVLFRVTASIGGANVTFYCTHLGSGKIPQQAQVVGSVLKDHAPASGPVILAGDFNAKPMSEPLSPIRASLRNVFTGSKEQPIDSFFVSEDIEVVNAQVVPDPSEASDHDPVTCLLKIPLRR